jgi:hypothetical protein
LIHPAFYFAAINCEDRLKIIINPIKRKKNVKRIRFERHATPAGRAGVAAYDV